MDIQPIPAWNASSYGLPAVAPMSKTIGRLTQSQFGIPLDPIGRATVKNQTTDQTVLALAPNGGCGAPSSMAYGAIIGYQTTAQTDSYGLPIAGGPQPGDDAYTYSFRQGQTSTFGFRPIGIRALPWLTDITAGAGTALSITKYGNYDFTDGNGFVHTAPGATDKVVRLHKLKVNTDDLTIHIDGNNKLAVLPGGGTSGGTGTGLGLYKSGFGIQINGTLPPSGVTATAIAGSGLGIGLYDYVATKRTVGGKESGPCAPVAMTTTTGNQEGSVVLPALDAVNDPLSIGYSLYRSPVGGAGTPIAQCSGVVPSVSPSGVTVYTWTGSGCTLTYDPSILAQPGLAGPPATPPLPIDPATGTATTFVSSTCSFTSGGSPFDQATPKTYTSSQGYHWVADPPAGTYLDPASDASISGNKRPPTDNTPEIDTLLATFDDTQNSPLHAGLINNAHSGSVLPLKRGLSANPDWVTIEINDINQLEVIGSAAAGQPCVEGNRCPVPSGGAPPPSSYGPGSTANGNNPGAPGSAPPGTTGGTTGLPAPGQNCSGGATAYYAPNYYQFAQFGTVRNIWTGTDSVELNIDPPNDGGNCHADIGFFSTTTGYDQFFLCEATVTSIGTGIAQIGGNFVQGGGPNSGSGSSTGANDGWAYTTADGWTCQRVGSNVFTPSIQPGPKALLGLYIDCNGVMHYYIAPYDGNLTEVYKSTGTVASFSMNGATPPTGQGWGGSMGFAPSGGGVSAREVGQINGIKAGHGLPGDLTINNFNGSGLPANSGTVPPCPSTVNPLDCTQWAQGYNDFLANTAATAPPTCPYGPNPFSDQCKAYDMGWWDGYNTFHASAPNTNQGSNSASNTSTSPTPTTPGTVPTADSSYWQAGYAAHQAGGSNTCPYTDATQCLYWTEGWQAATGSGTSSTTTNAPVPGTVPGGNATDYQAGYNAYINGLPITCPGGDTATQCQYYQQGWTDAASITTTSGSTTGSPGTGGTVAQGGGTIGGGGGTTGGTTLLTPPSGDICTGTAGAYPGSLGAMSGYQVGGYLCYNSGTGFYWFNDGTGQSGDFQFVSGTWSQVGGGSWGTYSPNGLPFGSKYSGIVGGAGSTGSGSTGTVSGAGGGSSSGIIQSGDVFVQGNESITGNLEVQSNETVLGTLLAKSGLVAQGPISSTGAVSGLNFQGTKVALTYAATISLNPALGDLFTTTTTNAVGNATINATSAGLAGQRIYIQITNDATAPRTITFGMNFSSMGTLVGTISKTAVVLFESDGTNWFEVGRSTSATPYSLPIASGSTLGGVKIGTGISEAGDGTISVTAQAANYVAAYNYQTDGVLSHYRIGLATSVDGRAFTRTLEPAITVTASSWKSDHVKDPYLVDVGGVLYLYYSGYNGTTYAIGLARSFDGGATWTDYASNPIISAAASTWETGGTNNGVMFPTVLYDATETNAAKRWKLWYSATNSSNGTGTGVGYAYSADGLSWTKYTSNPVLAPTSGFESSSVIARTITELNGQYAIFYGGSDGTVSGHWQTGLVTFSDPQGTYTRSGSNPLLSGDGITATITTDISVGDTTVTVSDATVFPIGTPVWVSDATHNYCTTVASRVPGSTTQLTLTDAAPVTISHTGGNVRSVAYNSVFPASARYDGGWLIGITPFQPGAPTNIRELSMLGYADDALGSITLDYAAGLLIKPTLTETENAGISFENLSICDLRGTAQRFRVAPTPPIASATVLGGVKIGSGITEAADGTISAVGTRWELIMTDGVTGPPVPIYTEDGTDWLYYG